MNYALISNKNNRHSRNNKTPPNSGYYMLLTTDPKYWKNIVGLFDTLEEAKEHFNIESSKERKWIQLICLTTRNIIQSSEIYNIYDYYNYSDEEYN